MHRMQYHNIRAQQQEEQKRFAAFVWELQSAIRRFGEISREYYDCTPATRQALALAARSLDLRFYIYNGRH